MIVSIFTFSNNEKNRHIKASTQCVIKEMSLRTYSNQKDQEPRVFFLFQRQESIDTPLTFAPRENNHRHNLDLWQDVMNLGLSGDNSPYDEDGILRISEFGNLMRTNKERYFKFRRLLLSPIQRYRLYRVFWQHLKTWVEFLNETQRRLESCLNEFKEQLRVYGIHELGLHNRPPHDFRRMFLEPTKEQEDHNNSSVQIWLQRGEWINLFQNQRIVGTDDENFLTQYVNEPVNPRGRELILKCLKESDIDWIQEHFGWDVNTVPLPEYVQNGGTPDRYAPKSVLEVCAFRFFSFAYHTYSLPPVPFDIFKSGTASWLNRDGVRLNFRRMFRDKDRLLQYRDEMISLSAPGEDFKSFVQVYKFIGNFKDLFHAYKLTRTKENPTFDTPDNIDFKKAVEDIVSECPSLDPFGFRGHGFWD